MMDPCAVMTYPSTDGLSEGPEGGSSPDASCSGVMAYQPTVDFTVWISEKGIFTTSSMGVGKAQCRPGPNSAPAPSRTGAPNRRMMARCCGATMKKPEHKNNPTRMIITSLTMNKLLRNASDNACEPASSVATGPGGAGVTGDAAAGCECPCSGREWSWSSLMRYFLSGALGEKPWNRLKGW